MLFPTVRDFSRFHRFDGNFCFVFDILNEKEVSDSEPFEMDFSDTIRVWFQMTRPEEKKVNLKIRHIFILLLTKCGNFFITINKF